MHHFVLAGCTDTLENVRRSILAPGTPDGGCEGGESSRLSSRPAATRLAAAGWFNGTHSLCLGAVRALFFASLCCDGISRSRRQPAAARYGGGVLTCFSCASLASHHHPTGHPGAYPGIAGDPSGVTFGPTGFTNPPACQEVVGAWAPGIREQLTLPAGVGQPLGTYGGYRSYVLQMHYANVNETVGVVDRSSFTFYYTPTLTNRAIVRDECGKARSARAAGAQRSSPVHRTCLSAFA